MLLWHKGATRRAECQINILRSLRSFTYVNRIMRMQRTWCKRTLKALLGTRRKLFRGVWNRWRYRRVFLFDLLCQWSGWRLCRCIGARFKKSELQGWIEYADFYQGASSDNIIKGHSKKNVVYSFEGKHLGEAVNTDISFPSEIILSTCVPTL